MEQIYGNLTDKNGRCIHYHTELDIIANRCAKCKKLYACYKCHDEKEDHPYEAVDINEEKTVMCGVCGYYMSYKEYSMTSSCPECKSLFNPRCSLHKGIYCSR